MCQIRNLLYELSLRLINTTFLEIFSNCVVAQKMSLPIINLSFDCVIFALLDHWSLGGEGGFMLDFEHYCPSTTGSIDETET